MFQKIGMKERMLWVVAIAAMPGSALFAQDPSPAPKMMAADARPQFEVAAIKRNQSSELGGEFKVSPSGLVNITNFPVMVLIQFAYDVPRRQISGGPSWLESERFDIVGKPDMEGSPDMSQLRGMLVKLLADRFQFSVHREKKELSAYALTVAKGGPKLTEDTGKPNGLPMFTGRGPQGRNVQNVTMADFASDLQRSISGSASVVDQTRSGLEEVRTLFSSGLLTRLRTRP